MQPRCITDEKDTGPERQTGRKAQTANIVAAKVGVMSHMVADGRLSPM